MNDDVREEVEETAVGERDIDTRNKKWKWRDLWILTAILAANQFLSLIEWMWRVLRVVSSREEWPVKRN